MDEVWIVVRDAALVIIAGAFVTGVYKMIVWLSSLGRVLKNMEEGGKERKKEMQVIFKVLKILMDSSEATMVSIRDGECNGEIALALKKISKANTLYEDLFLEKVEQ
jgi:hypothetical protein